MQRKINWGILGCAAIAERSLIPAIKGSANGVLYGIASRDETRAHSWADKHGFAKAYKDYAELLADPDVDAVYNPLPNHLHAEWSVRAARAGKHVLCEKPMALNAAEVRRMNGAADEAGVLITEAFMYKFHPQMEKTLELVRGGEIGNIRSLHSSFTFNLAVDDKNYRWSPDTGGGSLYDVGCYTISVARHLFSTEPVSVLARARLHPKFRVDVSTSMLLEFPDGRFAQCDGGFDSQFQSRLLVVGEKGTLGLDRAFSAKASDVEIHLVKGDQKTAIPIPMANMYTRMIEHFGECILERTRPRYSGQDAELNMRVIDACFDSIRTGLPVSFLLA